MKRVFNYLRSMRFGLLLLGLIAACSVIGTVIPQGREIAWYAQNYRYIHAVILLLRFHRVFESWYFILLLVLLCLNLSLCSLVRIRGVVRGAERETAGAAALPNQHLISPEGQAVLAEHMAYLRCRKETVGAVTVWHKNRFGRYGTFLTHLSILLTVIFGALALYTPTTQDRNIMPGETLRLEDGTCVRVESFRLTDETGRLDYELTERCFLSADGQNGLWFDTLYPDYLRSPGGEVTLITLTEGSYPNPIYQVQVLADGVYTPSLAVPGDSLEIFGLRFTFNKPVEYPGIRIKHVSQLCNGLLVAAFSLMILGLYVTFFCESVLVRADGRGYAAGGPRPERMRIELESLLEPYFVDDPKEENG